MNNQFNNGIYGEYVLRIIKPNGDIIEPFGPEKRKNLILDSFLNSILNGGYSYGIQSFIQTCRVGNSGAQANRSQTGLVGQLIDETSASSYFITEVNEQESSILLKRDFLFPQITVTSIDISEAIIGSFNIQNVAPITVSRFAFPGLIRLYNGDRLNLTYSLKFTIPYLTKPVQMFLTGTELLFDGNIRMSSNKIGITSLISGSGVNQTNTYIPLGNGENNYAYRDFTLNSNNTTVSNINLGSVSTFSDVFGLSPYSNKIGFFGTNHNPVDYPTGRLAYDILGDPGSITKTSLSQNDNSSSIDVAYAFPPSTSDRQVAGIYLSYNDDLNSKSAIYYKFNTPQTIQADVPIGMFLRWTFNRN